MNETKAKGGPVVLQLNEAGRSTQIFVILIGTIAACLGIPSFAAAAVVLFCLFNYTHRFALEQESQLDQLEFGPVTWRGVTDDGLHTFSVMVDGSALKQALLIHLTLDCDGFKEDAKLSVVVPPVHKAELTFHASLPEVGEWHLGELDVTRNIFGGFIKVRRRYPIFESVVIWPQFHPAKLRNPAIRGQSNGRTEAHPTNCFRGPHGDVRELIEYSRGDSARSIAWKASARHQKLLVRRRDELYENSTIILLNIGPTMRRGILGDRSIDRAISLTYTLAKTHERDPVGLILFDQRIVAQITPKIHRTNAHRIARGLIQIAHISDQDLTEVSDAEVLVRVSHFLRSRLPEAICPSTDPRDLDELHRLLSAQFDSERLRSAMNLYENILEDTRLKSSLGFAPLGVTARSFCQRHGLRLPYRLSGPDLFSREGLAQATEQAILMQPTSVLLVDHAQAIGHSDAWIKSNILLKRRGIDSVVYTVE